VNASPTYVLDANVFIEAARRYYAFDLAPTFWGQLEHHASNGRLHSIDRVRDEIELGKDELKTWAARNFHAWFVPTTQDDVVEAYRDVIAWATAQTRFTDAAKADFARVADGWLVAYAKAKGHVAVTHERPDPNAKARIPLPNACDAFGIRYVDTFDMLRALGVRF
jgi:hypothetical protein